MNTGAEITFLNPVGLVGTEITNLLQQANIEVITIYKDPDRCPEISIESKIHSYRGISQIRNFIKLQGSN